MRQATEGGSDGGTREGGKQRRVHEGLQDVDTRYACAAVAVTLRGLYR
jgi:hypothetical protein